MSKMKKIMLLVSTLHNDGKYDSRMGSQEVEAEENGVP
jgi:hypothetical protein